jgi:hypothetical protein
MSSNYMPVLTELCKCIKRNETTCKQTISVITTLSTIKGPVCMTTEISSNELETAYTSILRSVIVIYTKFNERRQEGEMKVPHIRE